jgi:hypothetical protein
MTAELRSAYQAFLIAAGELFSLLTAATEVKQRAHRILEFLDPYQPSPPGLGDLSQEYVFACNAFTQIAREEAGALRPGGARAAPPCRPVPAQWG